MMPAPSLARIPGVLMFVEAEVYYFVETEQQLQLQFLWRVKRNPPATFDLSTASMFRSRTPAYILAVRDC